MTTYSKKSGFVNGFEVVVSAVSTGRATCVVTEVDGVTISEKYLYVGRGFGSAKQKARQRMEDIKASVAERMTEMVNFSKEDIAAMVAEAKGKIRAEKAERVEWMRERVVEMKAEIDEMNAEIAVLVAELAS